MVIINGLYKSVCDIIVTTLYIERAKVYDVSSILIILHVIHLCPTYIGRFINKLRNISKPLHNYQNNPLQMNSFQIVFIVITSSVQISVTTPT